MGRPSRDRRQVFDGIWWRARTDSPWRDVPGRYGPWETAYSVFRRWQINGTWTRVLEELQKNTTKCRDLVTQVEAKFGSG